MLAISDFFDSGIAAPANLVSQSDKKEKSASVTASTSAVPEGFFDDPKADAKVSKLKGLINKIIIVSNFLW